MLTVEKEIIGTIKKVLEDIHQDLPNDIISNIYLEVPKEKRFGDFSTNIAMRITKNLKKPPIAIAEDIVEKIKRIFEDIHFSDEIENIKIEKPGFINFYLSNKAVIESLTEIIKQRDSFGKGAFGKGDKVQIEFVSANPTGPLTVAHGRQSAIGDSLARIMQSCGYQVTREYYVNDEGVQMDILAKSVKARFDEMVGKEYVFPENGYKGEYVYEIAREIKDKVDINKYITLTEEFFGQYAYKWIIHNIEKDLDDFGVRFDVWSSQKEITRSKKMKEVFQTLKEKGFLYEKDGALWFNSTRFGDDKDRVVIKKDGSFTYLAPDILYHKDKFERGYVRIINIWGPDHHGYVHRIKAACQALGFDKDKLSILISQLVTLYRDKKPIKMSTREGEFITLRQVIDEVGKDAGRFFFMMRRTDSHLDFDLELAKAKTMDNPVYYIQYATARISSVIRLAGDIKGDFKSLYLLDRAKEIEIIKTLLKYPKIIESVVLHLEPYILVAYLQDISCLFHSYYDSYRIITDDKALTGARISLIKAIKTVLSNGLSLLGVTAPEKM